MQNLYRLAENATDDETIAHIAERMNELEGQKREVERLLDVFADDAEEMAVVQTIWIGPVLSAAPATPASE
jgi:hypothetical protein